MVPDGDECEMILMIKVRLLWFALFSLCRALENYIALAMDYVVNYIIIFAPQA